MEPRKVDVAESQQEFGAREFAEVERGGAELEVADERAAGLAAELADGAGRAGGHADALHGDAAAVLGAGELELSEGPVNLPGEEGQDFQGIAILFEEGEVEILTSVGRGGHFFASCPLGRPSALLCALACLRLAFDTSIPAILPAWPLRWVVAEHHHAGLVSGAVEALGEDAAESLMDHRPSSFRLDFAKTHRAVEVDVTARIRHGSVV